MGLLDYLTISFAPAAGILFLAIFLYYNSTLEQQAKKTFYVLVGLEFLDLIAFNIELYFAAMPDPTLIRVLLSAFGHSTSPVMIYLILKLTIRKWEKTWEQVLLVLPLIINTIAAFSAVFTDLVFSYNMSNEFIRGPLGYIMNVVLLLYLVLLVVTMIRNYTGRKRLESIIVFAVILLIAGGMILEIVFEIHYLERTAIVLATIFYYMYFQTLHYSQSIDEVSRISQNWESTAKTDGLTGLLNKKAFLEELEEKAAEGWKQGTVLIFFDLDLFKEVNDKLGHLIGDQALMEFAYKLERVFADTNYICRFGGDEFCVFMEEVSEARLQNLLELALTSLKEEYGNNTDRILMTVSIGAGYLPDGGMMEAKELLDMADSAVYKAKQAGRNQYMVQIRNVYDMNYSYK